MPPGNYQIKYESIFGKTESVAAEIEAHGEQFISLCMDCLEITQETYIPIIDRLQNGEKYLIMNHSIGCFHETNDRLEIARKSDLYTLEYLEQKKVLSASEVDHIRRFEIELNYIKSDLGCTTTETYELVYKKIVVIKEDGGCNWRGMYYLKKALGLTDEK